jgi:exopolysaccharide production protein ExoQ
MLPPLIPNHPTPATPALIGFDRLAARDVLRLIEVLLFLIGLTYFTGALSVGPDVPASALSRATLLPRNVGSLVGYGVWIGSTLLILGHWRSALQRVTQTGLLCGFMALVLLSGLWSVQPDFVNLMNREVWQMLSFALFASLRFSLVQQLRLITCTLGIGAIVSALLAIGMPSIGQHRIDHIGAWKGLYDYKNTLGSMMIMGLLAFYLTSARSAGQRLYRNAGLGICAVIILLSTSKTALLLGAFVMTIAKFYQSYRWRGAWSIVLTSLIVPVLSSAVFLVVSNWVMLVAGLGKDPTLSGRTSIWLAALDYIQERPWLGFGRSAFWAPGSLYAIRAGERVDARYIPPHAHNGFLDLLLDVGFVGMALFFVVFIWVYSQSLWLAYNAQQAEDYWPVSYLTFLAMNNMTESFLLRLANPYWVLFLLIAFSLPSLIQVRQQAVRDGPMAPQPPILGEHDQLEVSSKPPVLGVWGPEPRIQPNIPSFHNDSYD